jgi:DNA-binding NtrC family response regulator
MESENLVAPGRSRFAVANDDAVRVVAPLDPFDLLPTPTVLLNAAGELVRANLAWREDPDLGGALLGGGLRRPYERAVRGPGAASAGALVQRVLRGAARAEDVLPWHSASQERWCSVEVSRVRGDGALVEHRDATAPQLAARRAMIDARLAASPSPARSEETLRWLCGVMGWTLAAAWTATPDGVSLALKTVAADRRLARGWAVMEETRGAVMQAWREGVPVWATPDTRVQIALLRECLRDRARDVRAVLAVPCAGGVVTFYSPHARAPEEALRALLMTRLQHTPAHLPPAAEVDPPLRARVHLAALSAAPVLLYGEAHTGKRTLGREIHRLGARADGPLVVVPSDATVERLAGLERWEGDARERIPGLAARARGGVLLIEDLEALPLEAQRWLGEAMSEGGYLPPGASEAHTFEARVIACARHSPEELRARGADPVLLDRLGALAVHVPPLRERRHELPELAAQSLATIARVWGVAAPALSDDAVRAVTAAPWEGNLRELRAVLERAWMGVGHTVTAASLAAARATPRSVATPLPDAREAPDDDARLAASERAHVERVLRQMDFQVSAAARLLGISRSKLYDRVHLWGLDLAAMRAASV